MEPERSPLNTRISCFIMRVEIFSIGCFVSPSVRHFLKGTVLYFKIMLLIDTTKFKKLRQAESNAECQKMCLGKSEMKCQSLVARLICFALQVELKLTRYEGGTKGPVIMFHGIGMSSGLFNLDTVETNMTEYLVQHR